MTSRTFSYLKKATHVVVLLSYLFHGVAPCFATRGMMGDEDGYTLSVQSLPSQMNGSVWPGVEFTLTQKDGDWVKTLEHRTFSSMPLDEEEQENVSPLKDRKNRSLGFSYDLKGIGLIYVCWEGSLLLHNLHFRGTALNIQTTGAILANNLDGTRLNLEGRAIAFAGDHNKISTLSLGFSEGLRPKDLHPKGVGSRMAYVMPETILVTHDLSVQGGVLQNSGRLSVLNFFEGIDTHVINDDNINAKTLTLKGGTLKNQGTLKAPVTAEGIDLLDNSGVIEGSWSVSSNSFINTGDIKGTGRLKTNVLENYGLLGDERSVFNIQKTAHNDGYLKAGKVTGNSTFTNHHQLETEVLDVPVFLNQQRENVPFKPHVKGESLSITKRVRQFTNDKDATIAVKRLVMESREGDARQVKNDGVIEGDNNTKASQITLQGNVENKGSIRTKNFAWSGSTFKTEDLQADHVQLAGERLQNLGSFEALSGSLFLHHLENQGDMTLTLTTRSKVASLMNKGSLTLNGTCGLRILINEKKAKLVLKDGTLITRRLHNHGAVTLDGFVTVLNDGRLQFGNPVFHVDTWQAPQHIQGPLGSGIHLSVVALDKIKKMPETALHVYGKSFSNTKDHVFLHPLHLIVETFSNTSRLSVPHLSVKAKTLENNGSMTGRILKLHASQNGQNKGRFEATQYLDVDLPQIGWLGAFISKGDLIFKTANRSLTLADNQSWLQVGRNLHMTLLNGNLKVTGNHRFPGNVKARTGSFTLEGEFETVGDLDVQTEGDINIQEVEHTVQSTEDLLNRLKSLSCDTDDHLYKTKENQAAVHDFVKHIGKDAESYYISELYSVGHGDLIGVPKTLSSLEEAAHYYPWNREFVRLFEYFLRTRKLPPLHTITLSRMKSGGELILSGQNVNNSGGEIRGETALSVAARESITHGSTYKIERRESRPYLDDGRHYFYSVPEIHGNGGTFITSGPLHLQAGNNILNNHGLVHGATKLALFSGGNTINKSGRFLSGGDADFRGSIFQNIRSPIVEVATGPYETGTNSGRWFVKDQCYIHGKNKEPRREYATSGPAYVQTLGNLTLDFSDSILNEASEILVDGALHETNAEIINTHTILMANAKRDWNAEWIPVPSVVADTLQGVISSGMRSSIQTLKKVLNSAIFVAPDIDVEARSFHIVKGNRGGREPQRKEETGSIIRVPLHHYAHLDEAFKGTTDQSLGLFPHVFVGSSPLHTELPLHLDAMQMAFAMQRGLSDVFGKGYLQPYIGLFKQLGLLHENSRHLALQSKGGFTGVGWKPLMVSEEEASKTVVPLMLYRVVNSMMNIECWIPQNYIPVVAKKGSAAAIADTGSFRSKTTEDTLIKGGTVYGQTDVDMEAEHFAVEDNIERLRTSYGYEDVRTEGEVLSGKGGPMSLLGRHTFSSSGGRIEAPEAPLNLKGHHMKIGASVCELDYADGKTTRRTKTHYPTHMIGGTVNVDSKTTLNAEAPHIKAKSRIKLNASLGMVLSSVIDTLYHEERKSKKSFLGSTKSTETTQSVTHQVPRLELEDDLPDENVIGFYSQQGSMRATAPIITAPTVVFDFSKGSLLFESFMNEFFYNLQTLDKNAFLVNSSTEGWHSTQGGGARVMAQKIVTSEGLSMEGVFSEDQLKNPDTFIKHLQQQGATLSTVHNTFQSWEETKTSVGPGLSALIAIGVSLLMPGIGTGTTGAMLTTGANTLGAQAVVGMINNGGNPIEALKDLTSGDSLRSLATTVLSAGLAKGVCNVLELPTDIGTEKTPLEHIEVAAIRATVNGALNKVILGKDSEGILKDIAIDTVVDSVGAIGAQQISHWYRNHDLNVFTHKVAHAFLGGATGALLSDDPLKGATSGALGALVAETFVELTTKSAEDLSLEILAEEQRYGRHPSKEYLKQRMQEHLQYKSDIGRLSATLAAIATDQDVTIASRTAANAVENNYILLMLGVACTIYEIYEGVHLWLSGDKEAALLHFGITASTAIVGGAIARVGGKLALKVAPTAIEILDTYKAAHPGFAVVFDKVVHLLEKSVHKVQAANTYVTKKVDSAVGNVSKKRLSPTDSTQIERSVTPLPKSQRTKDKKSPGGRADGAKTSGIIQPGADKNTIQQAQTSVKLRGTQNPKVRQAIQKGREEHAKLKAKIKEKSQKKSGWQSEERIENKRTGEIVIPDGITPSRRPLELKPNTPSGRKQGAKQLKKYEDATGKKGRVIYYDPNK